MSAPAPSELTDAELAHRVMLAAQAADTQRAAQAADTQRAAQAADTQRAAQAADTQRAAQAGNRQPSTEALEGELCRRFGPRVRLYGRRHLRSGEAAEDLAQRVLEIVLTKLRKRDLREPDRVASFVLGVARMETLAMRRRHSREQPDPDPQADATPSVPFEEPEPLARDRLSECLHALAERERSVLLLSYYHEQSAPQIAAALGVDAGHVRVIRHRAIARLRTCMGPREDE